MDPILDARWLLLIHQIPPKPNYFRVKVGRRLQRIGAVALKNSVYILPRTEQAQEDFQWVLREIIEEGGEATLCEATLVDGLREDQVQSLFNAARDEDYRAVGEEVQRLTELVASPGPSGTILLEPHLREQRLGDVGRLRQKLREIAAIDFFGAPARLEVDRLLAELETRLSPGTSEQEAASSDAEVYRGRTWVTRSGVYIDRIASAWLIRRFIDPEATLKFVSHKGYVPEPGELRFDMFDAEFTHRGDLCTFEVLLEFTGLNDPGLTALAEIVHDIDLKDEKFGRLETPGIASLIAGIAMAHREDEERIARACAVLDDLLEFFRRKQERA